MFHYFEAITNTKGDSLVGYFARVTDPATGNVVTIAADDAGTPIETVSGIPGMAKTDSAGNLSFYIAAGTYNLNIYGPDAATFIYQVTNVGMSQGTDGAAAAIVSISANTLAPGSPATAANVGTSLAAQFVLGIPAGTPGTNGTNGTNGADGTTGNNYFGYGVPANNQYINGDTYTDLNTGLVYGQKTGGKWPLGTNPDVNSATPNRVRYDMRIAGATLPAGQGVVTRNSVSTDMLPTDPYTYTPNTFAINTAVIRVGKGLFRYMRAQQQLANPAAPVTETITLPVGVHAVIAWGPSGSTYASAAGTAVGTGFGSIAGDGKVVQYLTITTAGTVTFTPAGGIVKANVQYNPSSVNSSEAVPYIASQSIREADQIPGGADFLAAMQATQGYLLMGVSDANVRNYGAPPAIFGMNGQGSLSMVAISTLQSADGAHFQGQSIGTSNFNTGATVARTWDASATVSFGGGDKFEASFPFANNNGNAVTSVSIGGASEVTSGLKTLNGCIGWWEYDTSARLTDEALYAAYTPFKLPLIDDILKNYQGAVQFRKYLTAYRQCQAGVIDHVRVGDFGSSHRAGTNNIQVNVRSYGHTAQMVADLRAEGVYAVNDDFFGGQNNLGWTGNVSKYDSRLTYTGSAPTGFGNQPGVVVIRLAAGSALSYAPTLNNARFRLAYYTGSGYGSIEVSKDGGTTPIVPDEGGSATISTNAASSIQVRNFSATLGANVWTIKAVGASVDIAFGYAYDPTGKQIVFANFGCYGYQTSGLSLDASPEQSVLLPVRTYGPHLAFGCCDNTNSMNAGANSWATFSSAFASILSSITATADVIMFTDPPSATSVFAQSLQDTIFNYGRALAWSNNLPMFDYDAWAVTFARLPADFYETTIHLSPKGVKRSESNPQKALFKRIMALA